jgi:cytochrome c5
MMFRNLLPLVIVLSAAATSSMASDATSIQLKTIKLDLPESEGMFPDGQGSDAINNNCLACHSADMVLNQPAMSREAWASEVEKMINNYKAPIAPEDVGPIVEYLATLKGTK